jgi:uncharacterized protein YuzE
MTFEYDKEADALYIRVLDGTPIARTEQIDPGTLVDVDDGGRVVGIDVVRPGRAVPIAEVTDRFELDDKDMAVLRALWPEDGAYPFADAKPDLVLA